MLKPKALTQVLGQVNTGSILGTLLLNKEGVLLAYSGYGESNACVSAAIASSVWSTYEKHGIDCFHDDKLDSIILQCEVKLGVSVGGGESPQFGRRSADQLTILQQLLGEGPPSPDEIGRAGHVLHYLNVPSPRPSIHSTNGLGPPCPPQQMISTTSTVSDVRMLSPREVIVELFDLALNDADNGEWVETARWIKYEEDAEGVDHHWGQPHVAFLSFHSLIQLRKCLAKGVILLDLPANSFATACEQIANAMAVHGMDNVNTKRIMEILQMKHTHVQNRRLPRMHTSTNLELKQHYYASTPNTTASVNTPARDRQYSLLTPPSAFYKTQPTIEEEEDETTMVSVGTSPLNPPPFMRSQRSVPSMSAVMQTPLDVPKKRNSVAHFISNALTRTSSTFAAASISGDLFQYKADEVLKKLADGAEAVQVYAGSMVELTKVRFVMARLAEAEFMPDVMEAHIPIRFIFVILGPELPDVDYHELGRSISTLMSNEHFSRCAYEAQDRSELIQSIDLFLDDSVVIPPGKVDSKRLLSGDEIKKALRRRKKHKQKMELHEKEAEAEGGGESDYHKGSTRIRTAVGMRDRKPSMLSRSGTLFGGLKKDIVGRLPFYWSDIRDAFTFQCLTSIVFMFFACFAPAITFGGLMGAYTNEKIGTIETLMAQCVCGVIWGLFSAQPLLIMSATGPVLIFEASLYTFCEGMGLDFLTIRLYAGVWLLLIAIVTVAFEGSSLLVYVTRFTEDIFAVLISAIFIAESLKFVTHTLHDHPVGDLNYYAAMLDSCQNETHSLPKNSTMVANGSMMAALHDEAISCAQRHQPDTGLLTVIIMLATFSLAYFFKRLRQSYYLGRHLRTAIGDFGVLLSIVIVGVTVHFVLPAPFLERLDMPDDFGYTNPLRRGHGLLVSFILPSDKWWGALFALLPALLVYILLFVETEITELLLTKKERGLVKGGGFHWDLLLMGVCALLCSLLGLPWMCAAAVQSLAHCGSLSVMKRHAPGERPVVGHVIEQRVTTIAVALLIGLFAFAGKYLKLPLASLFGVFLYLGVMNLSGVQMVQRCVLFFIPEKYFPDQTYCRDVGAWRMHLYTFIQIFCLVFVYMVKYFKTSALAFPFVLMMFIVIRQYALPKIFLEPEIKALDGHDESDDDEWFDKDFYDNARIPV
uniref:Anion exchange protein n=2 Tax=Plectus sambesii TaxID=2011161 RepID=A0A914W575_9BILA